MTKLLISISFLLILLDGRIASSFITPFHKVNPRPGNTHHHRSSISSSVIYSRTATSSYKNHPLAASLSPLENEEREQSPQLTHSQRIAQSVQPSLALVTPIGVRNITARGTGFVVDMKRDDDDDDAIYLMTAAHVAAPGRRIEVVYRGDDGNIASLPASVVDRDMRSDLALIRLGNATDWNPRALLVSDIKPNVGTLVYAHGYPGGVQGPAMTAGIVCAFANALGFESSDKMDKGNATTPTTAAPPLFLVTDAAMAGGMSGGPLVDMDSSVVGVNALIRPDLRALGNYAVDASECRSFLKRAKNKLIHLQHNNALSTTDIIGYRVVIFNDFMNTRARVAYVLKDIAALNETEANASMMQAHTTGSGTVKEFLNNRDGHDSAHELCDLIRKADVLAEVECVYNKDNNISQ